MISRNAAGWFFTHAGLTVGYYETKPEALDAQRGLERFDKFENVPGYIISDPTHKPATETQTTLF